MFFFAVTTTAAVERFFSNYNQLLAPQHTGSTTETLRMLQFLYWNLNTETHNALECSHSSVLIYVTLLIIIFSSLFVELLTSNKFKNYF